jgi:hypothetical protein
LQTQFQKEKEGNNDSAVLSRSVLRLISWRQKDFAPYTEGIENNGTILIGVNFVLWLY